jgi:hypothetical protein
MSICGGRDGEEMRKAAHMIRAMARSFQPSDLLRL